MLAGSFRDKFKVYLIWKKFKNLPFILRPCCPLEVIYYLWGNSSVLPSDTHFVIALQCILANKIWPNRTGSRSWRRRPLRDVLLKWDSSHCYQVFSYNLQASSFFFLSRTRLMSRCRSWLRKPGLGQMSLCSRTALMASIRVRSSQIMRKANTRVAERLTPIRQWTNTLPEEQNRINAGHFLQCKCYF